ncbi:MAG TPA: porin family protein [Bacteroidales bacterium]|nr:porin family protein [Bacteroidales bacterium]HPS25023.1 porin family protein [Bacteroidales bacterium]
MKKILFSLALLLCMSLTVNAQSSFVVKAGLNFNKLEDIKINNLEQSWNSQTGFHAGIGAQYRIPLVGLSFQPEILYSRMRTDVFGEVGSESYHFRIDYLDVPINVQWGINILFLRPYVFAAPYVRYAISKGEFLDRVEWDDLNRFDYGLSLGAGLEIWKLQISGKYSWSFGKLADNGSIHIDSDNWKLDDANMRGFELSVAFLF